MNSLLHARGLGGQSAPPAGRMNTARTQKIVFLDHDTISPAPCAPPAFPFTGVEHNRTSGGQVAARIAEIDQLIDNIEAFVRGAPVIVVFPMG